MAADTHGLSLASPALHPARSAADCPGMMFESDHWMNGTHATACSSAPRGSWASGGVGNTAWPTHGMGGNGMTGGTAAPTA